MSTRNDYTADQLADFARLLWPARMVLDACSVRRPGFEDEAADMAQRIVDLIGHGVSDEPPLELDELDELRAEVERLRAFVAEVSGAWQLGTLRRLSRDAGDLIPEDLSGDDEEEE